MHAKRVGRGSRAFVLAALAAAAGMVMAGSAKAQTDAAASYPDKPIHLIVGFAAGGGADILARIIGKEIEDSLKATVVVENKPGAASNIAAEYVARAKPDGYTILLGTNSLAVNPAVYKSLGYSTLKDLAPISMVGSYPLYLIVSPQNPAKSVRELLDTIKADPKKANSGGSSTALQLATQLASMKSGAKLEYVGYKGSNQVVEAVATGELFMALVDAPAATGAINNGSVKALAVTSAKRSAAYPDVPTMSESGVKDYEVTFWTGIFTTAGAPPAIVQKLQGAIAKFAQAPDFREKLGKMSVETVGNASDDFKAQIAREIQTWTDTAKAGNIHVE